MLLNELVTFKSDGAGLQCGMKVLVHQRSQRQTAEKWSWLVKLNYVINYLNYLLSFVWMFTTSVDFNIYALIVKSSCPVTAGISQLYVA